jgi:hypothetical protein
MKKSVSEIKQDMEIKLLELRIKRKAIVAQFKKRIEEAKIDQLKKAILGK